MAYVIKVDGTIIENCGASLKELQEIVGGYIQVVSTKIGKAMIINEEGKMQGLPINEEATKLYPYGQYDPIVGDVVICEHSELD